MINSCSRNTNNCSSFSIDLIGRASDPKQSFSLLSFVKQQELKRRKSEEDKADLIFKRQIKLMKKAIQEENERKECITQNTDVKMSMIEKRREWNDLTAIYFQNFVLGLLNEMMEDVKVKKQAVGSISLQAEPSMPLTAEEKSSIREKFRYKVDTTSVQFYDKIIKTDTVRPDLKIEIDGRKFIFDSKHYNSKSVRKSPLIGKVIMGSDESKVKKNEVSIYEVVKLYRDIHAFRAEGGGLILSPTTILSYSAKLLMEELNLITIKMTNRRSSPNTIKNEIREFITTDHSTK